MNLELPVYMDNHATTPLDPRVLEEMLPYFKEEFGNASSTDHLHGSKASQAVEKSREKVASFINARPEEIIFTSGATESDNIAILGVAKKYIDEGNHVITCSTEHKAVLDSCEKIEEKEMEVTYVPTDKYGIVDLQALENSITDKTILISIMSANNEIGTIAPVHEIGKIAKKHNILFHTDAAQALGSIPLDVKEMNIHLMSMSAHKIYGPKGVGALYVRRSNPRVKIEPVIYGGGHERGIRSGTLNVPAIVGFSKAVEIAKKEMKGERERYMKWTKYMFDIFHREVNAELNGHPEKRLPQNLNVYFTGIENRALINSLKNTVSISSGSACTTAKVEPSHVLHALGFSEDRSHCSVRFGLGRFNTEEEVEFVTDKVIENVRKLGKIKHSIVQTK